ncbi:FeoA family protein [Alteromonadaceae bacterium BrNp21-10]|nr:FeoA family protein [Alteromonadaceae bacterium BrNp21-10]
MTLWEMKAKSHAHIDSICDSLTSAVASRLAEMGFTAGQPVICVRRSPLQGPLVVQIGDCVYSLEQAVASKIRLSQLS